ncbi:MAG: ABC transporter ATP-binding protein [Granulosicoccus sp.]|nr:ABC transporter ATP-binding protein [Granulosicoccus sp.]
MQSEQKTSIVQIDNLSFAWSPDSQPVLDIEHFQLSRGERVFLHGPSGSGKTTLLSLIAAVLVPQSGRIVIDQVPLDSLRRGQRDQFRVDRIGLIFQQFNLLPFLSVADNVQLSCRFSSRRREFLKQSGLSAHSETQRLLKAMKLPAEQLSNRLASQLSVGQQQRVAVARALIGSPPLIIADEPTSSLDSDARQAFLDLLFSEIQAAGASLLFVSHDASLAPSFDRRVDLNNINAVAGDTDPHQLGINQ